MMLSVIQDRLNSVKLSEQDFFEDETKLYRVSQDFSVWGG